jgi:hypothetical protein
MRNTDVRYGYGPSMMLQGKTLWSLLTVHSVHIIWHDLAYDAVNIRIIDRPPCIFGNCSFELFFVILCFENMTNTGVVVHIMNFN